MDLEDIAQKLFKKSLYELTPAELEKVIKALYGIEMSSGQASLLP